MHSPSAQFTESETPRALISDESTVELVAMAQAGDRVAVEALIERSLPSLTRWAHGRLPSIARGCLATCDIVQEVAIHALKRVSSFQPRHVGAMQAYLRVAVMNRIRDEVRRVLRRPPPVQLSEELCNQESSPLDEAIGSEAVEQYRWALTRLRPRDRALVLAHVEAQWSSAEIQQRFGFPSTNAARMATTRALRRLVDTLRGTV
jgi:RNA polymerase sigma factor (sigma-70 family)